VRGLELCPATGVTFLPAGWEETGRVCSVLKTFLWCVPGGFGRIEVCSEDGERMEVELSGTAVMGMPECKEHEVALEWLSVSGRGAWAGKVSEAVCEAASRCGVPVGEVSRNVTSVMREVCGSWWMSEEGRVSGPLWLVDVALRLVVGEAVVFVVCEEEWSRAVVEMLSRREAQAFVVGVASDLVGLSVSVVEW
jgi:hypothetical protein